MFLFFPFILLASQNTFNETITSFLSQTYKDAWNDYQYIKSSNYVKKWDYVVITASNEKQAMIFRLQINFRLENHLIPSETRYLCISDPEGKPVGTGGATFNALNKIREDLGRKFTSFDDLRILIIHSGGDSKLLPQYSACGKLFSPIPRLLPDGHRSSLFDEFMILLAALPDRFSGGILTVSGDVLLIFNPLQISFINADAIAISAKESVEAGSGYGAFLSNSQNEVTEYLHKFSPDALFEKGAVNKLGHINIDTGMIWFSSGIVNSLWRLISKKNKVNSEKFSFFVNDQARLNFYADFVFPLASSSTLDQYLEQASVNGINDDLISCRKVLWKTLHNFTIEVKKLSPAKFIHSGTSLEFLELMTDHIKEYRFLEWRQNVLSNVPSNGTITCINSFISPGSKIGSGTFIENVNMQTNCVIGQNCIISSVNINAINLTLPDNTLLHILPIVGEKFCARVIDVRDNPKEEKFFGRDIVDIFNHYNISEEKYFNKEIKEIFDVNKNKDHSLWNCPLFPVCDTVNESLFYAMFLIKLANLNASQEEVENWLRKDRISLEYDQADPERIIMWQNSLVDQIRVCQFCDLIESDVPLQIAKQKLGSGSALKRELNRIYKIANESPISLKIKLYKAISYLFSSEKGFKIGGMKAPEFESLCYTVMKNENYKLRQSNQLSEGSIIEKVKQTVIELPVRVNWGGGWSDTPPYCYDYGGTVLNAAITLNGQKPVRAESRIIPEKPGVVIFESKDLKVTKEFTDIDEIFNCSNPFDLFALHKASLVVSGIIQNNSTKNSLAKQLELYGGGLYLSTYTNVPKGSGLGTSSILAAACLEALADIKGRSYTSGEICDQVLCVEQLMSTGGGWQDQIGGVLDGVKLIKSKPGLIQTMNVEVINVPEKSLNELNERFALIYTGQQRLARNILREIVGKVLMRDQKTIQILNDIQKLAVEMAFELERGKITEFAHLLNKHWELSKLLDPGTTNTCIDYIFSSCEDLIDGKFICGAGGGGFLQVILKKGISKQDLAQRLEDVFQESGVAVYQSELI